jgi:hypothetical protein
VRSLIRALAALTAFLVGGILGIFILGRAARRGWYSCSDMVLTFSDRPPVRMHGLSPEELTINIRAGGEISWECVVFSSTTFISPFAMPLIGLGIVLTPAVVFSVIAFKISRTGALS